METDWSRFCLRLAKLGQRLHAAAPDEQSRAQADGYLARLTVYGLEREFLAAQREQHGLNFLTPRIGGYTPDYRMAQARLDPRRRYRLRGRLNDAYRLGMGVYSAFSGGRLQLDAYATQREIDVDGQGCFAVTIEPGTPTRNRLPLQPTSNMLILRELDLRPDDLPAELRLDCLSAPADAATPPGAGGLAAAQQFIEGMAVQFLRWTQRFAECRNRMMPLPEDLDQAVRGDPGTLYYVGSFDLAEDEQLEIAIPGVACDYWGLALSTYWLEPLAARLNHATAQADADGVCRVRLSRCAIEGINALDTGGLGRGVMWYRTINADRQAVPVIRACV